MQIRPTAFTIGLIIHFSIALFYVYTKYGIDSLKARRPLSLRVITLLDKPSRRVVPFEADYSLFTIPDLFVIGYGLDYGEYYRNLPYIAEYAE